MKYFIDTEFIEGFHKPLFGKRRHHVDLISIGIYCEDGRSYYAISKEYNYDDADSWVKENVIIPMYQQAVSGDRRNYTRADTFHKSLGKSNECIAKEIVDFIYDCEFPGASSPTQKAFVRMGKITPEFYGYFADYDWVVFCSLFGRMIDLPKGFPMYCRDLKQMLDTEAERCLKSNVTNEFIPDPIVKGEIINKNIPAFKNVEEVLKRIKENPKYPKQTNEHNALADAKWNYELFKFLMQE